MSKITFENKKGKTTIINRLSYPETINERVYNAIASGMFEGFLPVYIQQKRKETKIECVVQGLIPITHYFGGIVTKKMFLDFVHEIALLIKNCDKNMINANNLYLQNDRIFIDPQTKKVKCIFWPVVNNQIGVPPHLFLQQLPSRLKFNPHEDCSYLETYRAFFGGINPFSVNNFDRMILKLLGMKSSGGHATPSEALVDTDHKNEIKDDSGGKKSSIEYDPFADNLPVTDEPEIKHIEEGVICPSCGSKNKENYKFCLRCGFKLKTDPTPVPAPPPSVDSGTVVLGDDTGGTTVLGYDEPEEPIYPTLICLRTQKSYLVDIPTFRIGSEQGYCDLLISDNTYVSRKHADIITRDERYYIVDHNSTNKTFVDGKVIPAELEVEIFDGTQLRLANEDFTFSIES